MVGEKTQIIKYGFCNECGTFGVAKIWTYSGDYSIIIPACPNHTTHPDILEAVRKIQATEKQGNFALP